MTFGKFEAIKAWQLARELCKLVKQMIALGSCGEVRSQLYRALDYGYITEAERLETYGIATRTGAAARSLVDYLNKTDIQGFRKMKNAKKTKTASKYSSDPNFPTEIPPNI